jgi:hypothetical protein
MDLTQSDFTHVMLLTVSMLELTNSMLTKMKYSLQPFEDEAL